MNTTPVRTGHLKEKKKQFQLRAKAY